MPPKQQKLWWYLMPHEKRPGKVWGDTEAEARANVRLFYNLHQLPAGFQIWEATKKDQAKEEKQHK